VTRDAYVGFGSNLGDPAATLQAALDAVAGLGRLTGVSRVYRTAPVGGVAQPDFLNAVARLATSAGPDALLDRLAAIERDFGRTRTVRFGPRTLDLDLIAYGGVSRTDDPRLILPHPRAHEREFVLRPLCDVEPGLVLAGRTAAELLAELEPQGVEPAGVELSWSPPPAAEV
jgi:2-amino-4-hydroxy-6-hydroxymethyldihydropteridine diphosphokinase